MQKIFSALLRNKTTLEKFEPNIRGIVCALGKENAVGVVYGKKVFGPKALFMKKMIDNRALYKIGRSSLILKKGRLNPFLHRLASLDDKEEWIAARKV